MQGRRLKDCTLQEFPDDVQPRDYWKVLNNDGSPTKSADPNNLTGTVWYVAAPKNDGGGYMIGKLEHHTVREHEDGTITVAPGDGSSNSIFITRSSNSWHGYIDRGRWYEV
jgi:hypothetical protein